MSHRNQKRIRLGLAVMLAGIPAVAIVVAAASPDEFRWTGNSQSTNDNWDDSGNWQNLTGSRNWPGEDGLDDPLDSVTIDDTNPQDNVHLNVTSFVVTLDGLLLGDGHDLTLGEHLNVSGVLQCEGVVDLFGAKNINVYGVLRIYADQDTTVEFVSGGGLLAVGGS
ncbi:MAG: hypothetical protein FLDDKLPJ_01356 [Phycisphaerae bacterium]|nr:hypothetical protein [Phycisphaerae bacterium]